MRVFNGWTATCNNLGACVATAAVGDEADLLYPLLKRDAGATAPPAAKIVLGVQDAKGPFDRFRLAAVDGSHKTTLPAVAATAAKDDPSTVTGDVGSGAATLGLIEATRNATTLEIAIGDTFGTLDLKGLSAALRYIDDRQGRVGGATALVAKGMTPIGQVPGPMPAPIVTAAPAGSVTAVAKPIVTPALLALAAKKDCDADTVKAHEDLKAWRVAPERILVAVPCQSGAYNFQSALYFTDAKGKPTAPANLPQPTPSDDAPNLITNGDFDPKTMELSTFAKGRGIGDCGLIATWVWTGEGFTLLTASGLDSCPGALSDDWPNIYTAVKR